MAKFKIGDRVRNLAGTLFVAKGEVGTVIEDSSVPFVKWDTYKDVWCRHEDHLELVQENKSIHITTQGNTMHAVLKQGNKVVKRAKATCSPSDEFNFEFGAKLAFSRLIDGVYIGGVDMAFNTVKEVNRPAKVGEWVKIINAKPMFCVGQSYSNGDCFKVTKTGVIGNLDIFVNGVKEFIDGSEYIVLENYQPTQPVSIDYSKLDGAKLFKEVKRRVEENGTNTRQ